MLFFLKILSKKPFAARLPDQAFSVYERIKDMCHGLNADYRPSYDKAAATYAMKLTRDRLKERGV